ncbi:MAG: hypothetical protein SNG97_07020 [Rikenellaceae bacterium]
MEIKYGDILLSDGSVMLSDGDLVLGNGKEQQIGAIVQAVSGNFRQHPTIAANVAQYMDGVVDSTAIASNIIQAGKIDGWSIQEIDVDGSGEDVSISIVKADKVSDNTNSLI